MFSFELVVILIVEFMFHELMGRDQ